MLENRLRKTYRHLSRWARRIGTTAWRIYDRDIPEHPFAVDVYGDHAHVQVYRHRRFQTEEEERAACDEAVAATASVLSIPPAHVHVKVRERRSGLWQYEKQAAERCETVVTEGGHKFIVNLSDYLDTGLFLDHRETRRIVGEQASGKSLLNLFAYTGSFSVYAATGGARETVTVDLSATYLDWAARNLQLNGVIVGRDHRVVRSDVFRFLTEERVRGSRYDLIVLDPPTVSTSKKMTFKFDVQTHHAELLAATLSLLAPGGILYFSSNFQGFELDAFSLPPCRIEDISLATIPEDFRNKAIHKCFRITQAARTTR